MNAAHLWDRIGHWAQADRDWETTERCYGNTEQATARDADQLPDQPEVKSGIVLPLHVSQLRWKLECAAGFEAQVDHGTGAPIIGPDRVLMVAAMPTIGHVCGCGEAITIKREQSPVPDGTRRYSRLIVNSRMCLRGRYLQYLSAGPFVRDCGAHGCFFLLLLANSKPVRM